MEHLSSQALDHKLQLPVHLAIHAIGYSVDDEFENHFITHDSIQLTGTDISVKPLTERNYAVFDVFNCGDALPDTLQPEIKRHFFPRPMEVSKPLRVIIRA